MDLIGKKFGRLTVISRAEDKIYKDGKKIKCGIVSVTVEILKLYINHIC